MVKPIGVWGMTTATTKTITGFGIAEEKILSINVSIIADSNAFTIPLAANMTYDGTLGGYVTHGAYSYATGNVTMQLSVDAGSYFNNGTYFGGSGNRGWITIEYIEN